MIIVALAALVTLWLGNKLGSLTIIVQPIIVAAIALGGMKLMIPNLVRYPIMALPVVLTAAASGIAGRFLGIMGDKVSAGFGIAGLVGPIKAYELLSGSPAVRIAALLIAYLVVPFGCAMLLHILFTKIINSISRKFINPKRCRYLTSCMATVSDISGAVAVLRRNIFM